MDERDFGPNDPDDPVCVSAPVRLRNVNGVRKKKKIMRDKKSKQTASQ